MPAVKSHLRLLRIFSTAARGPTGSARLHTHAAHTLNHELCTTLPPWGPANQPLTHHEPPFRRTGVPLFLVIGAGGGPGGGAACPPSSAPSVVAVVAPAAAAAGRRDRGEVAVLRFTVAALLSAGAFFRGGVMTRV